MKVEQTPPAQPPTHEGRGGRAWQMSFPPHPTQIAGFLLYAPAAHPAWSYYLVSLVHLRDVEGFPPAHRLFQEATHETTILALDPSKPLPPVAVGPTEIGNCSYLEPANVVQRFAVPTDTAALRVLDAMVLAIVQGAASPDSDWRSFWKLFIESAARHTLRGH